MSRRRKRKEPGGYLIGKVDGRPLVWLKPKFIFDLCTTHGLPLDAIGERMNELDAITDWQEVARLMVEHENLSKANSKFSGEIFAQEGP